MAVMQPIAWIFIWGGISLFAVLLFAWIAWNIFASLRGIGDDLSKLAKLTEPVIEGAAELTARIDGARASVEQVRVIATGQSASHD